MPSQSHRSHIRSERQIAETVTPFENYKYLIRCNPPVKPPWKKSSGGSLKTVVALVQVFMFQEMWREKVFKMILSEGWSLFRTSQGHRQSTEHWNCFKGNVRETSERRGGAHMGFSKRIDTILNWTELSLNPKESSVLWKSFIGDFPHTKIKVLIITLFT